VARDIPIMADAFGDASALLLAWLSDFSPALRANVLTGPAATICLIGGAVCVMLQAAAAHTISEPCETEHPESAHVLQ
jgi:hypothetical protein